MLVHKHLIVRAECLDPPLDPQYVEQWLKNVVELIGMKVCRGPISAYVDVTGNEGATGVVIIETSHIAIHVWDRRMPALVQLDVYTCGAFEPQKIFNALQEFDVQKLEYKYLDREHELIEIPL
jgi:S-adenosylmethionine/arginine decarboxylase-like enzyme